MNDDGAIAFAVITNLLFVFWVIFRIVSKGEKKKNLKIRYTPFIEAIYELPQIEIIKVDIDDNTTDR